MKKLFPAIVVIAAMLICIPVYAAGSSTIDEQPALLYGLSEDHASDTSMPETEDVKELFLRWRLTTNQNDRWTVYQQEINSIFPYENEPAMEEIAAEGNPKAEEIRTGVVMPATELQEKADAAAAAYYSAVMAFTSEDLIREMIRNRTPMKDDELYTKYGASMEFIDVTFGEGKEDPFVSGLIYDFDARVVVHGYENIPNYPYKQDEDGYFHMKGQITVDEGLITKVYLAG